MPRECLDCDFKIAPSEPAWRTRCRPCYSKHRNSLKMRECEDCGLSEKREAWKKICTSCFRKRKLKEKEERAGPITKVPLKPTLRREITEDYDFSSFDCWD